MVRERIETAPPWTRRSSLSRSSWDRSRRTVSVVTSKWRRQLGHRDPAAAGDQLGDGLVTLLGVHALLTGPGDRRSVNMLF